MKRILLLTPSLDYGGAEVVVTQLALYLAEQNWKVCVASMLSPRAFSDTLQGAGVAVESLEMKSGSSNLAGVFALLALIRRFRPDVVHSHMFHANVLTRIFKPLTRVPVVCTAHSTLESARNSRSTFIRDWAYYLTDRFCDRTTTVSEAVRARYLAAGLIPSGRVETIPNGVDTEQFRPDSGLRAHTRRELGWQDSFIWLAVGRLELAKDFPRLMDAFKKLAAEQPAARLVIAGDGSLRPQLEAQAAALGMRSSIQFLGTRTDIAALLNGCDAFVLSSAWEGGPIVLLEAGAVGRPVVATAVGAAPEIILPDRTGFLVPPEDTRALILAMQRLMNTPTEEREAMGTIARLHISKHYSVQETNRRYQQIYNRVLATTE
jgi:glycosyltransferase involved in cell wall biosynthesis